MSHKALYRFSLFVTAMTLLLVAAGGLVTSHEAGLAVPDWPRSYGQWMPPMVGNVFWEHGHRMIAGSVAILTLILCVFVQKFEKRTGIQKLAWAALGVVFLQALLGGLTVLFLLPHAVSIAHACLAQTFFCLQVALSFCLRPRDELGEPQALLKTAAERRYLFKLWVFITSAVYLQLILGATVRHTGLGVGFHAGWAVLVFFLVFMGVRGVALSVPAASRWHWMANLASAAVTFQFFLGVGAYIYTHVLPRGDVPSTARVLFTSAHQTNGAIVLGLCFLLTLRARE